MDDIKPPKNSYRNIDPVESSEPEEFDTAPIAPKSTTPDDIETVDLSLENKQSENKAKPGAPKFMHKVLRLLKNKKTLLIVAIILIVIAGGLVYWFVLRENKTPQSTTYKPASVAKKIAAKKVTSPLTGVELSDATLAKRPVTGLMIENSLDARPQSGLIDAGLVVEAVAEGGITRFLALFQESTPQYIGPVRSARPYYVDFALAFDASLGHVGGSPDAMNDIKSLNVKDLDQFYNAGGYWRINDRAAPHNVYTSFERLDQLNKNKGYTSSGFTPLEHKKDVTQTPTASSIDLNLSGPTYNPHFQYDPNTNSYKRSEAGGAHIDLRTGTQISPKVVVALVMTKGTSDGYHGSYGTVGSGKAYVFQDGIISQGTWTKADRKSSLQLTDKNGLPLKINAGQAWITLVGSGSDVSYQP